jgi:formylglycine-generating enzyme required for sulfatase activity
VPRPNPHHDLLFGILALQWDFVSKQALLDALRAWVREEQRPLRDLLVEHGSLGPEDRTFLDSLVQQEIAKDAARQADPTATAEEAAGIPLGQTETGPEVGATQPSSPTAPLTSGPPGAGCPAPRPQVPSRYRVLRPQARGGLGEVFVAEDTELHREVALKEIQERHADHLDSRARFLLEAEITGRLEHPGIVPVYGLGLHPDGRPYYAMRLIRGDSLSDAIARFHAPDGPSRDPRARNEELRRLLARFVAVCNAIAYAHSRGVLHRDLKPANIMLGPYGETLVVDWGVAKTLGMVEPSGAPGDALRPATADGTPETRVGNVLGTPAYMPPEQASGQLSRLGPASDVYSLGATLYCLLTGKPPFEGPDVVEILVQVQRGEFLPPRQVLRSVPPALEAICLKAMAHRPEARYAGPLELARDVEHWLADAPVSAYREGWVGPAGRWARRHRPAVAAAGGLLVMAVMALAVSTLLVSHEQEKTEEQRRTAVQALAARSQAQVQSLLTADPQAVPAILRDLQTDYDEALPQLRALADRRGLTRTQQARLGLALLPVNSGQAEDLCAAMLEAEPREMLMMRQLLLPHRARLARTLWPVEQAAGQEPGRRFRAAVALAAFDPANPHWKDAADRAAEQLLAANPLHLGTWAQALRPVRSALLRPLQQAFRAPEAARRQVAATVLADYAADQPRVLAELLLDADVQQYAILYPEFRSRRTVLIGCMEEELEKAPAKGTSSAQREALARRQANAAITLLKSGKEGPLWRLLQHSADPGRRSYLVDRLGALGADPAILIGRLEKEEDVSARRALLLALGGFGEQQLTRVQRRALAEQLLKLYRTDPDPGIHSAADWLLRRWGHGAEVKKLDDFLATAKPTAERRWFVNGQGQTLAVVRGPVEFDMGSPETEPDRHEGETLHRVRIPRSFAIATRPVTVKQFLKFEEDHDFPKRHAPSPDGPVPQVTWLQAVRYCRWLSEKEGIPEEEMCYPPLPQIKEGMKLPEKYLTRTGYRLPTEAEWEYACRAGAVTSRCYGSAEDLLGGYAWYSANGRDRTWPVGQLRPNDLGLFDVHGNLWQWCQDRWQEYPEVPEGKVHEDREDTAAVTDADNRVMRGGAFSDLPLYIRCAQRDGSRPTTQFLIVGLRVARTRR